MAFALLFSRACHAVPVPVPIPVLCMCGGVLSISDGVVPCPFTASPLPLRRALGGQAEDIVTMDNGCVCCTVRGDLVKALINFLERRHTFDCILLETTGIADPSPIVATFNQVVPHFALPLVLVPLRVVLAVLARTRVVCVGWSLSTSAC